MTETGSSNTDNEAGETPALQSPAVDAMAGERTALQSAGETPAVQTPAVQTPAVQSTRRKYLVLLLVFTTVVVLDQWTKYLAVAHLTNTFEHHGRHTLVERVAGFFTIRNLDNEPYDSGRVDHRKAPAVVVPQFWNHRYVENPGAAWGFLSGTHDRFRVPFFHVVSVVAILFIAIFYRRLERNQRLLAFALSLVLGGAVGNYIDRLARNYVIDFVDWHWRGRPDLHWPTFNLADVAISIGVLLMLADTLFSRRGSEAGMRMAGVGVDATAPESGGPEGELPGGSPKTDDVAGGAEPARQSD